MSGDIKMSLIEQYRDSGELPDDPEILLKLHAELQANEAVDKQVETTVEMTDGVATDPIDAEVKDEATPEGILSKDGKHVIPYDALTKAREQEQAAKREAQELRDEIERLKSPQATQSTAFSAMTEEQLADLKEYFPDQYEILKSQQDALVANQNRLRTLEDREAQRIAEEGAKIAQTVQENIDNNPELSHWQRNDPVKWARAVQMDTDLRTNDPEFANLTQAEQFAKVASAMVAIYGSPVKTVATPAAEPVKPTLATAKPVEKPPINSLSDLGAGIPAESSLRDRAEDMSQAALINNFMSMTADQRAEFIARM